MLQIFLIVIFLGFFQFQSNAQLIKTLLSFDEYEIGGGASLVTAYNKNITSKDRFAKIGYVFRIGANYKLSQNVDFNLNLIYERKGLKTRWEISYFDPSKDSTNCKCTTSQGIQEINSSSDYLTISGLPKFKFGGTRGIDVGAGIFFSYLVRSHVRVTKFWDNTSYAYVNTSTAKGRLDGGITLTIGYGFTLKENTGIRIDMYESYGLVNILNPASSNWTKSNSVSIQLSIFKRKP